MWFVDSKLSGLVYSFCNAVRGTSPYCDPFENTTEAFIGIEEYEGTPAGCFGSHTSTVHYLLVCPD